jgi:hypothetical protein
LAIGKTLLARPGSGRPVGQQVTRSVDHPMDARIIDFDQHDRSVGGRGYQAQSSKRLLA